MLGTYEYSDFPMDEGTFGVKPGQHIPAAVVHDYLTKYAQHFDFFGNIRFKTKVQSAQPGESGGWLLKVTREEQASNVLTKRLIVATGLTTEPYMPTISGSGAFGGLIFHTSEFQSHEETLSTSKDVTVLGGEFDPVPSTETMLTPIRREVSLGCGLCVCICWRLCQYDYSQVRPWSCLDGASICNSAEKVA